MRRCARYAAQYAATQRCAARASNRRRRSMFTQCRFMIATARQAAYAQAAGRQRALSCSIQRTPARALLKACCAVIARRQRVSRQHARRALRRAQRRCNQGMGARRREQRYDKAAGGALPQTARTQPRRRCQRRVITIFDTLALAIGCLSLIH